MADEKEFVSIPLIKGADKHTNLAFLSRGEVEVNPMPCQWCKIVTYRVIVSKLRDGDMWNFPIFCCDFCFKAIRTMAWEFKGG